MRRRIGILGGTFNPIHYGHLIMAEQALTQLSLDAVLFMPDYRPPHVDHKTAIDAQDRVNMINLAIKNNSKFQIELIEIKRMGKSYSYDTLSELKQLHPNVDYYFIVGGDMVEYLPKWYRIDDLIKMVKFVGVNRPGNSKGTDYPVTWINSPEVAISSSLIRSNIKNGSSVRYLLPDEVLHYIEEHHLYE